MAQKVIVSSSELGQIWHAIIVRNVGFEIGEMSEEYIGDCYDKMVDIKCEDGTIFHCKTEMNRASSNEISFMPFDEVETWLQESIKNHEHKFCGDRTCSQKEVHAYENLLKNAERLREMMMSDQQIETPAHKDVEEVLEQGLNHPQM